MAAFAIAYTASGGASHNIIFRESMTPSIAREYDSTADFSRTASGGSVINGRSGRQKYIWAISSLVTKTVALELDTLFRDWDNDRASGQAAACGVLDQTFGPDVSANVVFTSPPTYTWLSPTSVQVDFGVTEV